MLNQRVPSKLGSPSRSCSRYGPASRLALWATLSPELRTTGLLPPHVRVGFCQQNGRSGLFYDSLTVNSDDLPGRTLLKHYLRQAA